MNCSNFKIVLFFSAVFSTCTAQANQKPIANAGENQTVGFAQKVILSAEKSIDHDGVINAYRWLQTKGIRVKLNDAKTETPTFVSPKKATTLIFKVTVTDNKNASSNATVEIVVNDKKICVLPEITENGVCVNKLKPSTLNDTGITFCSDGAYNVQGCGIPSYPHQDGDFGRDVVLNDYKDGHAGFSFSKIGEKGETLPLDAKNWACVKDSVSGKIWENKTLQNASEFYRFDEVKTVVETQNKKKLCGRSNWRLPEIQELQNIVNYSFPFPEPAIDLAFFANSTNKIYWSATFYAKNNQDAWGIYFDDGRVFEQPKNTQAAVRFVSSPLETNAQKYVISDDGQEVLDTQTGLIWRRCVEGMKWNGKTCEGLPFAGMLVESLERAVSQTRLTGKNWRLPNIKELSSLVDFSKTDLAIDTTIFPQTPNDQFWSSSPYAMDAFYGWVTHFYYGSSYYTYLEDTGMIRLVHE